MKKLVNYYEDTAKTTTEFQQKENLPNGFAFVDITEEHNGVYYALFIVINGKAGFSSYYLKDHINDKEIVRGLFMDASEFETIKEVEVVREVFTEVPVEKEVIVTEKIGVTEDFALKLAETLTRKQ